MAPCSAHAAAEQPDTLRTALFPGGDRPRLFLALSLLFFHGAQQRLLPMCCADPAALRASLYLNLGERRAQGNFFGGHWEHSTARLTALYLFSAPAAVLAALRDAVIDSTHPLLSHRWGWGCDGLTSPPSSTDCCVVAEFNYLRTHLNLLALLLLLCRLALSLSRHRAPAVVLTALLAYILGLGGEHSGQLRTGRSGVADVLAAPGPGVFVCSFCGFVGGSRSVF
ncbi:hypothetical protein NDU88_000061 [Pleurodeles waltl]|uniref:Uncharacterized protein n=1 Tax=Pleurodeles waltl TaxID=8319 RepID=A0AAV7S3I1_PLEWA|nr:hypothetical protein NDU88_000061 [Pleurodeles waltl]